MNLGLHYLLWRRRLEAAEIRREWTEFDQNLGQSLEALRKEKEKLSKIIHQPFSN